MIQNTPGSIMSDQRCSLKFVKNISDGTEGQD
jgi:hypothetical protein